MSHGLEVIAPSTIGNNVGDYYFRHYYQAQTKPQLQLSLSHNLYPNLSELNNLHPSIKFTMSHTTPRGVDNPDCGCTPSDSLAFLDTLCTIQGGKIVTELYRKKTDRNQYLLTSSCHPAHTTQNIPFSLALRIVRICSLPQDREKRFQELKELFHNNYVSMSHNL